MNAFATALLSHSVSPVMDRLVEAGWKLSELHQAKEPHALIVKAIPRLSYEEAQEFCSDLQ